ncbi:MAG: pyridoxal-phosphate dependent enzyme [Chloroflexi bacterium]|nr:pyridoxal-phosphate dependent enzyme [Chloroflexota bacterium]
MKIACVNCGRPYPDLGAPYECPNCGGLYDYVEPLTFNVVDSIRPGTWRYASSFGLSADPVSLGEGNTPLISAKVFGREVYFKCEYANPSGSFKDRGMATLVSFLVSRGVTEAIEDSSGNAGASFAAYAARAGIKARVYVPESASGPKRQQIEMYGAQLVTVRGPRVNAAQAVRKAAQAGMVYASHAYLPFCLPGYATCAYEIVEQLGGAPGAVVVPAGQGGLLLGIGRGFQAMLNAGMIEKMPMIVGAQASACQPLVTLWKNGTMDGAGDEQTLAEGVRTRSLRAEAVVKITRESGGRFTSVDEAFILSGRDALANRGFYVEPTSALVWRALEESISSLPDPVVAILTGSGYKVRI